MTVIVTRGDARNLQLPDETVDLIVTSPPYFGLRSYQDGGEHYAGQVGDEATPAEYLDALTACTAEWMRVLKPGGSIFVNLGDKYAGGGGQWEKDQRPDPQKRRAASGSVATGGKAWGHKPKTLIGLPWRYAIRCIDELGLILRAEIVWAKPNGLPESVTDRVRRSHEQVFHFVKQSRYYSAVDEVREPHAEVSLKRAMPHRANVRAHEDKHVVDMTQACHPLGKLPGSVWTIPTSPLKVPDHLGVDHFAAYPPELVRRIILGWSPAAVCAACGEGLRPQVLAQRHRNGIPVTGNLYGSGGKFATATGRQHIERTDRTITGYACACESGPGDTTPGVVLDPFGGTGTTALVASAFGRIGISVDLSADYCRLARWRTTDPGERARVLQVPKPPEQVDGQLGMFEGIGA